MAFAPVAVIALTAAVGYAVKVISEDEPRFPPPNVGGFGQEGSKDRRRLSDREVNHRLQHNLEHARNHTEGAFLQQIPPQLNNVVRKKKRRVKRAVTDAVADACTGTAVCEKVTAEKDAQRDIMYKLDRRVPSDMLAHQFGPELRESDTNFQNLEVLDDDLQDQFDMNDTPNNMVMPSFSQKRNGIQLTKGQVARPYIPKAEVMNVNPMPQIPRYQVTGRRPSQQDLLGKKFFVREERLGEDVFTQNFDEGGYRLRVEAQNQRKVVSAPSQKAHKGYSQTRNYQPVRFEQTSMPRNVKNPMETAERSTYHHDVAQKTRGLKPAQMQGASTDTIQRRRMYQPVQEVPRRQSLVRTQATGNPQYGNMVSEAPQARFSQDSMKVNVARRESVDARAYNEAPVYRPTMEQSAANFIPNPGTDISAQMHIPKHGQQPRHQNLNSQIKGSRQGEVTYYKGPDEYEVRRSEAPVAQFPINKAKSTSVYLPVQRGQPSLSSQDSMHNPIVGPQHAVGKMQHFVQEGMDVHVRETDDIKAEIKGMQTGEHRVSAEVPYTEILRSDSQLNQVMMNREGEKAYANVPSAEMLKFRKDVNSRTLPKIAEEARADVENFSLAMETVVPGIGNETFSHARPTSMDVSSVDTVERTLELDALRVEDHGIITEKIGGENPVGVTRDGGEVNMRDSSIDENPYEPVR